MVGCKHYFASSAAVDVYSNLSAASQIGRAQRFLLLLTGLHPTQMSTLISFQSRCYIFTVDVMQAIFFVNTVLRVLYVRDLSVSCNDFFALSRSVRSCFLLFRVNSVMSGWEGRPMLEADKCASLSTTNYRCFIYPRLGSPSYGILLTDNMDD